MLSRADSRKFAERALRLTAYAALAVALVFAVQARTAQTRARVVTPRALAPLLADVVHATDSIALVADTALDPLHRDWLAAHKAAGRPVRWSGATVPATAVAVEPLGDPAGGDRVLVAAPHGAMLQLGDSAGALDSAESVGAGVSFVAPGLVGVARVSLGRQQSRALRTDSIAPRRVVVLGRPSWETKFVIAALEERGWIVDLRTPLAPDTSTVQGTPARLDTSRVAAVVVLDASASTQGPQLTSFVRQGGGLVLGPLAASEAAFAQLRAGTPGGRVAPTMIEVGVGDPRRALPLVPVESLAPDALALERRDAHIAIAARRVGPGRVIQVGYDDTWRWRMTGPEGAAEAHRRWWSSLVAMVAYRATLSRNVAVSMHDAPRARMVATLGPSDSTLRLSSAGAGPGRDGPSWWLCALAFVALLAEWASRRLRGAA